MSNTKYMKTAMMFPVLILLGGGVLAAEIGNEVLLPASPLPAHDPCVSFGAGKHLVVWQSGKAGKADIYGCRVDESGKALDTQAFAVSKAFECQERPRAAWGKDSWLVVWADLRNDKDYDVYAARVTAEGKVLDPEGIAVVTGAHNQAQPDVAFNGETFLVTWRAFEAGKYAGRGMRVSTGGRLLDTEPIKIGDEKAFNMSVGELRVGAAASGNSGGKWLAAWVSRPSSLTSPAGGGDGTGLFVSSIASDGKVSVVASGMSEGMNQFKPPVTLASNGKDACLLSWFNSCKGGRSGPENGMPYGAMRVDFDGKALGTTVFGSAKVEVRQPAAVWDGKGWLVLDWQASRKAPGRGITDHLNRIVAHMVGADGVYGSVIEISNGKPNPGYAPAGAGDGRGNCLVAYERHPDKDGETIVVGTKLIRR